MTWEELVAKSKEMGAGIGKSRTIYFSHLEFEDDGGIYLDRAELDEDENVMLNWRSFILKNTENENDRTK